MRTNNKKAISPVVATALLLVVAVVAVVGFQSWFATYNSQNMVKVEQQSAAGSGITAERLEVTTVYLKNPGEAIASGDITGAEVRLASNGSAVADITYTSGFAKGLTNYTVGAGVVKGIAYEVVIFTDSGIYTTNVIAR